MILFRQYTHDGGKDMLGIGLKGLGCFVAGTLFGTAGVKVLSSKDAKNVYVKGVAVALRAKDCVMETVTSIQAGAEDIYAEAKALNEERAKEEEVVEEAETIIE